MEKWGFRQHIVPSTPIDEGAWVRPDDLGVPLCDDRRNELPQAMGKQRPCGKDFALPFPREIIAGGVKDYYVADSMAFGGRPGHNFLNRHC